jgi:hypothetical protein
MEVILASSQQPGEQRTGYGVRQIESGAQFSVNLSLNDFNFGMFGRIFQ